MTSPKLQFISRLLPSLPAASALLGLVVSLPSQAFDLNDAMFNSESAYSATQTTTVGKDTIAMDVFKEGKKMRMNMSEQGQNLSIVIRMDTETNYMLMHEMSMFQEVKSKRIKQYQKDMNMQFTNQQKVGMEEANGFKCAKYTADFDDNNGTKGTGTYWINSDDIMVRAVMTSKRRRKTTETTTDITNLQVGDQPDDLFEVPEGYKSFGLGALLGNSQQNSQEPRPQSDQERAQNESNDETTEEGRGKNVRKALKGLFGRGNG